VVHGWGILRFPFAASFVDGGYHTIHAAAAAATAVAVAVAAFRVEPTTAAAVDDARRRRG
jgi:hypothetical protein